VVGGVDIGDLHVLCGYVQCETCSAAGGQQATEVWHGFIIITELGRVNLKPGAPADVGVGNNHCSRTLTSFVETWLSMQCRVNTQSETWGS
jgi:hypothetical protein